MSRSVISPVKKPATGTRALARLLAIPAAAAAMFAPLHAMAGACQMQTPDGTPVQHVIYIQFDNTHFNRDTPNVPSDLEQMPHLLNFMEGNGTLLTNDHTILISHTAGGMMSTITGVYPDRNGQTVSNSYVRTSATGSFSFPSSFSYWTDSVSSSGTPTVPNIVTPAGLNAPAPWVPFTRAGCDFGAIGTTNVVVESVNPSSSGDITKVFGNPSAQETEAQSSWSAASGTPLYQVATTDFEGLGVHCAQGSALCANGQADLLPAEPNGYAGFMGLFGAQELNPALVGGPVVNDINGNPITDSYGQPGFPGFDGMVAPVTLGYIAAMQEKGIPVTYAYISDAHDNHGVNGNSHTAYGPGDAGYVAQLASYDQAFEAFFSRLAADGINKSNTLFVFTVDEGDHFVGQAQTNCDGIDTPCVYGANQVGEVNANIDTLVSLEFPTLGSLFLGSSAANAFTVHGDDAPTFYLATKGSGMLPQTNPTTRDFERDMAVLTAVNPYTGNTDTILAQMADQAGMKALHMYTSGDPARNPTFVFFGNPNYFLTDYPTSTCQTCINPAYAWNHGDIQPEIANTWVGYVGPGVKKLGAVASYWTDHTDVRPTMLTTLGLKDDYVHDGRAVVEALTTKSLPSSLRTNENSYVSLSNSYKKINASFGQFAMDMLAASTHALAGGSDSNDSQYTSIEGQINSLTASRDNLATQMKNVLDAAAFNGQPVSSAQVRQLVGQANNLLKKADTLAQ
jgi:hypothetical protein